MICTFYSYKGGVGRTLALANIAELLYHAGLRVLVVDWDLAAPGLERHFPSLDWQKTLDQPGLIDLLLHYKEYMSYAPAANTPFALESPSRYLTPVYNDGFGPGSLHLLTAGRRAVSHAADYAQAVLTFDWQEFYDIWEGEPYLNWLRTQFEELADIVLIDCRAGLSEMGNVCTYHLADLIVMFCTADQQNLQGAYEMAQQFTAEKVRYVRAPRPLQVMLVPSRIDEQAGEAHVARVKDEFARRFNGQNFPAGAGLITVGDEVWALRIPQAPTAAVTDKLLARLPADERPAGVYQAYQRLIEYVVQQTPPASRLREFIKPHLLQSHLATVEEPGSSPVKLRRDPYRLPVDRLIKTRCEVNLRPTPGYSKQPPHEAIQLDQGVYAQILDGPQTVDGLRWWLLQCKIASSTARRRTVVTAAGDNESYLARGWVAEKSPNGVSQLQRVEVPTLDSETIASILNPYELLVGS